MAGSSGKKKASKRNASEGKAADKKKPADQKTENVPAGAEDFEHTMRRLVAEKARKRSKNFGLYL